MEGLIRAFTLTYGKKEELQSGWREPVIGFAQASDPLFSKFKEIVSPDHLHPEDLLPGARTVISYFIPFSPEIVNSNLGNDFCSRDWAIAYVETNKLIEELNNKCKEEIEKMGFKVALVPPTHNFSEETLLSNWSHRHVAFAAGLGDFGINNMLITEKGSCGRVGSFVTDLEIAPSSKKENPFCLEKAGEVCGKCLERCPVQAFREGDFSRRVCYDYLLKNDSQYPELELIDACGKCCVGIPCSLTNPVGKGVNDEKARERKRGKGK